MREFVGSNDMMAYLVMMAQRLVDLHRVLKPTGSLYLHCDPTASHYLKLLLDAVFGVSHFRNEIIWRRTPFSGSSKSRAEQLPKSHDVILFYSKGAKWTWNAPTEPYSAEYLSRFKWEDSRGYYRKTLLKTYSQETLERLRKEDRLIEPTKAGSMYSYKQYLSESSGTTQIDDLWTDITMLNPMSKERLGYPTQKPLALLERIIEASSNPGDVVLDPFCGCGTAVVAAQKLDRRWIGIDVTHLAISLMKNRLTDMFGETLPFDVHGTPEDVGSARMLAEADRYEFQYWANSLVNAQPIDGTEKKGADRGIDGVIRFIDDEKATLKRVLVQVKSGHVQRNTMGELRGTIEREHAEMGMLITLDPSTKPMRQEAIEAGTYYSPGWDREYPRMQIWTIEELLAGAEPKIPPMRATFQRAQRLRSVSKHRQSGLFGD